MGILIGSNEKHRIGRDTTIIFDHLVKCAGTSFCNWLKQSCPGASAIRLDDLEGYNAWSRQGLFIPKIITGHAAWGAHHLLPGQTPAACVTMLRDPLKRAVSMYTFTRNIMAIDSDIDLETYLLNYRPNQYTQHFGQGSLDAAMDRLFGVFASFGVVECYAQSLERMGADLQFAAITQDKGRLNVSPGGGFEIRDAVRQKFLAVNGDDYRLYHAACERLERRASPAPRPAAARTGYTATLPEINAALEQNRFDDALALVIAALDTAETSDILLLFAAHLAERIGDGATRERMLARLHREHPLRHNGVFIDHLLQRGDRAGVEAEIAKVDAVYAALPEIPPDSALFEMYAQHACAKYKALHALHSPERHRALRELVGIARASSEGLQCALKLLCGMGRHALAIALFERCARKDKALLKNQDALEHLALARYHTGDVAGALEACRALLALCPHKMMAVQMLLVCARGGAVAADEAARYFPLVEEFKGTLYAWKLGKEIAMNLHQRGDMAEAMRYLESLEMKGKENLLLSAVKRGNALVPFDELPQGGDCLVMLTGPQIVFSCLVAQHFAPRGAVFDVLKNGQARLPGDVAGLVRNTASFAGKIYYDDVREYALAKELKAKGYEDCIVVMSDFALDDYQHILTLAREIARRNVYVYSLDHLLTQSFKRHVTLYAAGAQPQAAERAKTC